jgi:hypothetical protein
MATFPLELNELLPEEVDLQLPLELNIPLLEKFNMIDPNPKKKKPHIDVSQICNLLLGGQDLNFLYNDGAMQIFTSFFNNSELYAFEILFNNLVNELLNNKVKMQIYHIKKNNIQKSPFVISKFSNITVKGDLRKVPFSTLNDVVESVINGTKPNGSGYQDIQPIFNFISGVYVLCLFEYDEGTFGHYGTMFFDGVDTIYNFDSMMHSKSGTVELEYNFNDIFIKKLFIIPPGMNFTNDIFTDPTTNIYSLEITGGSYNVENPLITYNNPDPEIENEKKFNAFKQYIIGVDNQNQFCYMWAILYILLTGTNLIKQKNNQPVISFIDLHQKIILNKTIPVVAIKIFILILLRYYEPLLDNGYNEHIRLPLIRDTYFMKNFRKFISNSIYYNSVEYNGVNYYGIFDDPVHDFKSYAFTLTIQMNNTNSLSDICSYFISALDTIRYDKVTPVIASYIPYDTGNLYDYILAHIVTYNTRPRGKNLINAIDKEQIKNIYDIHNYVKTIINEYDDLTISAISASFQKSTKRTKKVKYGGSIQSAGKSVNKTTYYKFKNLDLKKNK